MYLNLTSECKIIKKNPENISLKFYHIIQHSTNICKIVIFFIKFVCTVSNLLDKACTKTYS